MSQASWVFEGTIFVLPNIIRIKSDGLFSVTNDSRIDSVNFQGRAFLKLGHKMDNWPLKSVHDSLIWLDLVNR